MVENSKKDGEKARMKLGQGHHVRMTTDRSAEELLLLKLLLIARTVAVASDVGGF